MLKKKIFIIILLLFSFITLIIKCSSTKEYNKSAQYGWNYKKSNESVYYIVESLRKHFNYPKKNDTKIYMKCYKMKNRSHRMVSTKKFDETLVSQLKKINIICHNQSNERNSANIKYNLYTALSDIVRSDDREQRTYVTYSVDAILKEFDTNIVLWIGKKEFKEVEKWKGGFF